jgi:hypothetical protein
VHVLLAGDLALARSRAEELLTLGMERNDPVGTDETSHLERPNSV